MFLSAVTEIFTELQLKENQTFSSEDSPIAVKNKALEGDDLIHICLKIKFRQNN